MLQKNMNHFKVRPQKSNTFDEDFLRHHAKVALEYVRIVEKEAIRAEQADRVWFRDWQCEIRKSTLLRD